MLDRWPRCAQNTHGRRLTPAHGSSSSLLRLARLRLALLLPAAGGGKALGSAGREPREALKATLLPAKGRCTFLCQTELPSFCAQEIATATHHRSSLQVASMELVSGAMGSLLPKLGELLKEEYGLQKGVRKKIQSLSRELEAAHAVLRKIGDVPPEQLDELVRLWARDVREASYDMEDIVETFLVRVDDGAEPADPHRRLRRLRKKVAGLFKKSKARRNISCLIQEIYEKLDEVAARRGRYTLDSIVPKPATATTIDPRILNLFKRATELVGIEGPRDELINMLSLGGDVDEPSKKTMKVVSVVGFGGLGKTTLAKAVYDQLKPRFERSAFVPVGRNPDVKKVFRDILIDLDKRKYANSDLMVLDEKQLIEELEDFIKEKRYEYYNQITEQCF